MPNFDLHLRGYRFTSMSVLLGTLAWAGVLAAQEPSKKNAAQSSAQDSGIVLRQTVRRVRVDVVVTDAQGNSVKGLQASDFRIAEDGKPQSIRQFEYHSDEIAEAARSTRPLLPPHTFMNLPAVPERGPLTVLLYDMLNAPLGYRGFAHDQMIDFLRKIPGRRIAIFVLGDQLRLVQGFTSDTDSVERAITSPATKPQQPNLSYEPPSAADAMTSSLPGTDTPGRNPSTSSSSGRSGPEGVFREMAGKLKNLEEAESAERLNQRVGMTLAALKEIGRYLEGISGRKNLIWFTGSFPIRTFPNPYSSRPFDNAHSYRDGIGEAVDLLNSAEVSVYVVDARGLMYPAPSQLAEEIATMDEIGEKTGGRAFYNTNGLEQALEKSSAEGSSYYSMVYAPTNANYDGSVRRVSVHIEHEHYHLAYRRSYIADDVVSIARKRRESKKKATASEPAPFAIDSMDADTQFGAPPTRQLVFAAHVDAIGKPAPATAEQMAALAPYREQVAKAEHKKHIPPAAQTSMQQYTIQYEVRALQLDLPKTANGAYRADLSVGALAFNDDGETLWGTRARIEDDIPAAKIDKIREDGFQVEQPFLVPLETAVIRLVVRDEHSGKIGSMEIRLPLPPDKQQAAIAR